MHNLFKKFNDYSIFKKKTVDNYVDLIDLRTGYRRNKLTRCGFWMSICGKKASLKAENYLLTFAKLSSDGELDKVNKKFFQRIIWKTKI